MDAWFLLRCKSFPYQARLLLLVTLVACGTHAPVVAKPPESPEEAVLEEPWIADERAMMRNPSADLSGADSHSGEAFNGPLEDAPRRGVTDVIVDVIAFPFRGIGWLFQALF